MAPLRPSSPPLPNPSPNGPLSCRSNNDDNDIADMSDVTAVGLEDDDDVATEARDAEEETAGKGFNKLGIRLFWSESCIAGRL